MQPFRAPPMPRCVRKAASVDAVLPWPYLCGVSADRMGEALAALLGERANGLSPNTIGRLKAQWADELKAFRGSSLKRDRWVFLWAAGVYFGIRAEHWVHLRTSNPIDSSFATARHRSDQTRGALSRETALSFAFTLMRLPTHTGANSTAPGTPPKSSPACAQFGDRVLLLVDGIQRRQQCRADHRHEERKARQRESALPKMVSRVCDDAIHGCHDACSESASDKPAQAPSSDGKADAGDRRGPVRVVHRQAKHDQRRKTHQRHDDANFRSFL